MATFEESYADATDQTFLKRVTIAMYKVAQLVAAEDDAPYTEAWYQKRQQLAKQIKYQAPSYVQQFSLSVCSGGVITDQSPDNDIEFTVTSQWDAFAGVTELDKAP
jgi:hypothetical protein